jgi:hypothetical protein
VGRDSIGGAHSFPFAWPLPGSLATYKKRRRNNPAALQTWQRPASQR